MDMTGVVNNGPLSVTLSNHNRTYTKGFNLIGNPYPSPIDWDATAGWLKDSVDNALYYFKASTTDQYGGTYSTYNAGVSSDGLATNIIPSMQGFFVHVTDGVWPVTGILSMNNSVRVTDLTHSFLKSDGAKQNSLLRLSTAFSDDIAAADPFVIYFDEKATAEFDSQLDALKLMNTDLKVPNLYSVTPAGKKLSISAMPEIAGTADSVPLGLKLNRDGYIIFRIRNIEGAFSTMGVSLYDKLAGITKDLLPDREYKLYLTTGEYLNRFFLNLSTIATGVNDPNSGTDMFSVYSSHGVLKTEINILSGKEGTLKITNLTGQTIYLAKVYDQGYHEFNPGIKDGIYIVSYITGNKRFSKKIFIFD
jgi:fibronectin-binding autotransporter adhesin